MNDASDFSSAMANLEESYRDGIRAFAVWVKANWGMTHEQWVASIAEPAPSQEWFAGNQAGIDSIEDAAEMFLEEHLR